MLPNDVPATAIMARGLAADCDWRSVIALLPWSTVLRLHQTITRDSYEHTLIGGVAALAHIRSYADLVIAEPSSVSLPWLDKTVEHLETMRGCSAYSHPALMMFDVRLGQILARLENRPRSASYLAVAEDRAATKLDTPNSTDEASADIGAVRLVRAVFMLGSEDWEYAGDVLRSAINRLGWQRTHEQHGPHAGRLYQLANLWLAAWHRQKGQTFRKC